MEYIIRKPELKDAEQIIEHKEIVTEEYPDTLATPIEDRGIPLEKQEDNITSLSKEDLGLVVEVDGRIVGILNLRQNPRKKFEHVCQFGVSLQPQYAGHGIGTELIDRAVKHAEESKVLEKIVLDVFSNNEGAIRFYERLGFVQEGRQKDQVKLKDGYTDLIQMAKFVK
ncbi:N-acetyltransferase family protein [Salinicoccus sp. Marseille-QA3877]